MLTFPSGISQPAHELRSSKPPADLISQDNGGNAVPAHLTAEYFCDRRQTLLSLEAVALVFTASLPS